MTTEKLEQQMEKVILFVDDQWGRKEDPMIPELYGNGKVPGYTFLLESAKDNSTRQYSAATVISRMKSEPKVDGILLDMDFGMQAGFGEHILRAIRENYPQMSVIVDSSSEDQELVKRCLALGAKEFIRKTPSAPDMKIILDKYLSGGSK